MFKKHLLALVSQGLDDLAQAQTLGKVPTNPKSESHFFSVWIGAAIKNKQFDVTMLPLLQTWQQQARTCGAGADFKNTFAQIKSTYQGVVSIQELESSVIASLIAQLDDTGWQVTTNQVLIKKTSIKSQGVSSLVFSPQDIASGFDASVLLSCYVRGEHQEFIDACYALGMLAFKVTEYKSIVKFHGHYVLHRRNNYKAIAQYPSAALPT